MVGPSRRFKTADIAQQTVGGFLLAGPFVVTAEVWQLATEMSHIQGLLTALIVFGIGYGALYKADNRDPDRETEVGGVPVRFLSLMVISFGSVAVLATVFDAPTTFLVGEFGLTAGSGAFYLATAKAVAVGAVFSVVGAATADSVF